jgi:hypothetical protein
MVVVLVYVDDVLVATMCRSAVEAANHLLLNNILFLDPRVYYN